MFDVVSGSTPSTSVERYWSKDANGIKWITPKDLSQIESASISQTERKITTEGLESCSARIIPKESIILSSRAPIGYVAVLKDNMACNQGCKALIPRNASEVYPLYFYYLFLTKKLELNNLGSGSTFKELSKTKLEEFEIKVHDFKTQQQIAQVLEQSDKARQQRKAASALTDDFLQSSFLSLFGDPVKNEKGWEVKTLNHLCDKITDGTHDTPQRLRQGIKYITGKNIRPFYIDLSDLDFVTEQVHREIYKRCNPEYGDILYTNIGVNLGTAVMNYLKEEFSMKNVALLKLKKQVVESRYIEHTLNFSGFKQNLLKRFSIGGAQSFLSLSNINKIELPVPPIPLQQQFSVIVEQAEQLRQKQKESEQELEQLFQSLLQKYFG